MIAKFVLQIWLLPEQVIPPYWWVEMGSPLIHGRNKNFDAELNCSSKFYLRYVDIFAEFEEES